MQLQQENQFEKNNLLRKCGLLAHTSPAFLKNCWIKKLLVACGNILGKPPKSGSARLGHIPSLPWESQLPLKPYLSLQPSDFEGNCDSLRFSPRFSLQFLIQFLFASQMWAARPHLGSIFEKLLHRKTFYLPAARSCKNYGVLYDFHTVFIDTHQQECYNIDVHRKNEFR